MVLTQWAQTPKTLKGSLPSKLTNVLCSMESEIEPPMFSYSHISKSPLASIEGQAKGNAKSKNCPDPIKMELKHSRKHPPYTLGRGIGLVVMLKAAQKMLSRSKAQSLDSQSLEWTEVDKLWENRARRSCFNFTMSGYVSCNDKLLQECRKLWKVGFQEKWFNSLADLQLLLQESQKAYHTKKNDDPLIVNGIHLEIKGSMKLCV